ncbi:MAG: PDZ domain-containing protein [Parachlamydia sp.]|nr:PDZ domain-containing protein [Parachlamydia sp.]
MFRALICLLAIALTPFYAAAKLPNITAAQTTSKLNEIMKAHAVHHQLSSMLVKRVLLNYLDELDPTKTYFIESDISAWLEPSDALVKKILADYRQNQFDTFSEINQAMVKAILRRRKLDKEIDLKTLPSKVNPEEFKNMKWTISEEELLRRITRLKALQIETAAKLNEELKEKSLQRIAKRQTLTEEEFLNPDPVYQRHLTLTDVLKAFAAALDAHTAYFTPDEATQFMINVQQRLFGIGAQLRDDVNGFSVVKIVEGSPASRNKQLKIKDRIIAVNGEPVVGMDIVDVVEMIRGEENTPVSLTVIREDGEGEAKTEEKLDITIPRGEVVLKESRFESSHEAFGDGAIAYLRLYSFYQDPESSSTDDITKALEQLRKEHPIKGVILDLRYNSGGLLSQAVGIAGLFITKGTIASIKDETGAIQHLRDLDGKMAWDGPLIILTNRASASASEIVAQSLQDYGRALIVGDDHTYGKGTFQTFTLNTAKENLVNPQGEYKVTRGLYYTVSGKTPQMTGVLADIIVPGPLSEMEIGEKFAKYPLENDHIKPNFDDDLADVPYLQRAKVRMLYKFNLQPQVHMYDKYLAVLKTNSEDRIKTNKSYQKLLTEIQKKEPIDEDTLTELGAVDLQLTETYNIMKDLLYLQKS